METSVNNGMCRCCASEGAFKDVKSTYHWMGEEEIYSDMLRDCFDINLEVSEQGQDGGICEVCITQLRNAINFKKQVLHTEEQFKIHLQNKTMFRPNIVKVELQAGEDSDDLGSGDDAFSGPEFEVPIKMETEETKPKKRGAKASATTTRAKKAKTDNGETSNKRNKGKVHVKTELENVDSAVLVIVEGKTAKNKVTDKPKAVSRGLIEKHQHNLRVILKSSNATPILRVGGVGYMCSYCFKEFPDPKDLKEHYFDCHDSEPDSTVGCTRSTPISEYCIKLDITNLTCNICGSEIDSLEDLTTHLQEDHNELIYTDIDSHIMPFKFDSNELTCCLCSRPFYRFKILLEHMHKHFRNYVCEICDAGFINKGCLTRHANIHRKGVFPCSFCCKVFDTNVKKKVHERVHTSSKSLNRCGYCNEGFKEHHLKEQHLFEVHGVSRMEYKCNACDRGFDSKRKLRIHVKRDHLLERKHKCLYCDSRFFTGYDVKKHMIIHTGEKEFECPVCLKAFARKSTLVEHLRIHNDDRRFKCTHCGMAFVQKCSLKGHLRSKHGEIL
ncbi:gastrula zinc finger protein XlCGF26.1-like isoform X4 [Helicoverpa zea]|uniref:gastrula zinc finger protein XlCGF26.1-like isoform X4 n=1 Tax=Helicoverpa zea TaxID=7113 RepID=UPI001F561548|nr:gastrula zinc finger protein XlCGF26.1-like isoform X4 [Helicoverpa zea]